MTPAELSAQIGEFPPTPQQHAVITASTTEPHLVIAGAGSGKTATMANRVVWLVATGVVNPAEILGLTFTRKAAGELETRVSGHLDKFDASRNRADQNPLAADRPTVSTYNAFAASVYRDHALLIGYEPEATVISESVAWRLAHRVVAESRDPRLNSLDIAPSTLVDAVLSFARELADHGASGADVRSFAEQVVRTLQPHVESIPQKTKREPVEKYLANVALLPLLVDLAAEYQAAKRARGFIEFSDQVALAHRIITEHPSVAESYRQRYRIILLDEYQDTSVAQTRFLAELFRGCGVMAVGDPDQSIYGFRGASAANLSRFSADFGPGRVFPLSTSWRNDRAILDVANTVTTHIQRAPGTTKEPLTARDQAEDGTVDLWFGETIVDEAHAVAEWCAERIADHTDPPTLALLLRAKKHFTLFADALRERGIPVHILGLSGLLYEPVIVDLMAALAVIADSTANAELVRVLVGARWAIGPADIRELHALARKISDHDDQGRLREAAERAAARHSAEDIDTSSLIDALDLLAADALPRADWAAGFSPDGLARLRAAGAQFALLRRRSGLRLADFVDLVIHELQLDIEAQANPNATLATNSLEAFADVVEDFLALAEDASLPAFLEWLEAAEKRETLAPRQEPAEAGTVQIMTIHAAKGLEWDYVALPRLVTDEMPSKAQDIAGWLLRGRLPFPFRGDSSELPRFNWDSITNADGLLAELGSFIHELREAQLQEEWRLGYVAVTRPRRALLLSGSWWAGQRSSRGPGVLLESIAREILGEASEQWPAASLLTEAPVLHAEPTTWPLSPLGNRAPIVHAAAEAVRAAGPLTDGTLARLIDVLIAERDNPAELRPGRPTRIPASRVKDYLDDADAVGRELGRPLPQRPYSATRLGTLFHSWVEHRAAIAPEIDAFDTELDLGDSVQQERLSALQATFERSPWAALNPVEVEREIHLPLAGQIFICKIDAVYDIEGINLGQPEGARLQIVDWKTGAAPVDERDLELKQTQLALYRLAYATHLGVPVEEIDAVFYFVAEDRIVRPTQLVSIDEFVDAWRAIDR